MLPKVAAICFSFEYIISVYFFILFSYTGRHYNVFFLFYYFIRTADYLIIYVQMSSCTINNVVRTLLVHRGLFIFFFFVDYLKTMLFFFYLLLTIFIIIIDDKRNVTLKIDFILYLYLYLYIQYIIGVLNV